MTSSISPIISSSSFAILDSCNMVSASPNCTTTTMMMKSQMRTMTPLPVLPSALAVAKSSSSSSSMISRRTISVTARPSSITCGCGLSFFKSSHSRNWTISAAVEVDDLSSTPSTSSPEDNVGSRVRVKEPLKVYHVPKVPELDLMGMEGEIKQYVGLWKGKRISANLPYKVQFVTDIPGRGPVKFFAHLKEDEFEYI